jgi:hypothetical protein
MHGQLHQYRAAMMRTATLALLLCFAGPCLAEELTLGRYILEINVDGAIDTTHYFKATDSATATSAVTWGAAGCPNAQFVYTRDLDGQKDVLAIAMTAVAIGRSVVFRGTCDPDGMYFRATRIVLGQ